MRKLIFISSVFFICACETNNKININPDLKKKLDKIIESYEEFVSQKDNISHDPEVIEVTFKHDGDDCYLVINTNYFYNSNLDGFIFTNNKLVTFNNTESKCNCDGLIKVYNQKIDLDQLNGFIEESKAYDDYHPAFWTFKLTNNKLVLVDYNRLKIDFD